MKLSLITFALSYVGAQNADDPPPTGKKFSAVVDFALSQVTTSLDSSIFNKRIQNYGCHCFPGNTRIPGGKGPAVDDMDNLCRELSRCRSCVSMNNPGHVDADQGQYKYSVTGSTIDCSANTDNGKLEQCLCDKEFAIQLGQIWDDATYDYTKWWNKNNNLLNFDAAATCVAGGAAGVQDQCCGSVPNWRPYNSAMYECCSDGSLASVGSC